MAAIINMNDVIARHEDSDMINVSAVRSSCTKIKAGLITVDEAPTQYVVDDHTSEPIKSMDDIMRISRYLLYNKRYRDNMLFIVGINFGLRVSDLIELRFSDIINSNCTFKDTFPVFEKKTRNTRKQKKNRYITINSAVMEAVTMYLENTPGVKLSDYMFTSVSSNNFTDNNESHLTRCSVDRILKGIASDLDLNMKVSTHTLRKTFAYHQMVMSNNDPRKLLLLSKMMGHSSITITLDYIGITNEEIEDAYRQLNLGSETYSYLNSGIVEYDALFG